MWADSLECHCYLRNVEETSWQTGKHPCERRFGEPFDGPVIPFGAMVEYRPISSRDQPRLHQIGEKVLIGILGHMLIERNLERTHYGSGALRRWKTWTRQKSHPRRLNATESVNATEGEGNFWIPRPQMEQPNCLERDHGAREPTLRRE